MYNLNVRLDKVDRALYLSRAVLQKKLFINTLDGEREQRKYK